MMINPHLPADLERIGQPWVSTLIVVCGVEPLADASATSHSSDVDGQKAYSTENARFTMGLSEMHTKLMTICPAFSPLRYATHVRPQQEPPTSQSTQVFFASPRSLLCSPPRV
jgi:hypothetical protein